MSKSRSVVFLEASPKKQRSTSVAIGSNFITQLENRGWQSENISLYRAIKTEKLQTQMFRSIDSANLVVISFPLYVDCLPSGVIRGFELIHTHRISLANGQKSNHSPGFLAIINCGFPEAHHNHIALEICKVFAQRAHFTWHGGLSIGMGGVIGGQSLANRAKMAHNLIDALIMAAEALTNDQPIPSETYTLAAKPFMPPFLYARMGNLGWNMEAKQNGVRKQIKSRPFTDA